MMRKTVRLFQYGSNMNPERLNSPKRLNGEAQVIGVARLDRWGIRFNLYSESKENKCGVTNIVPSERERVLGILYQVPYRLVVAPRGQRSRMDQIEGARLGRKGNYKRKKTTVRIGRKNLEARTYIGTAAGRRRFLKKSPEERRVSETYFSHVLAGADTSEFPKSYVAYLRRQAGQLK